MAKINSSHIHDMDYDSANSELTVHFKNGAEYVYYNITEAEYNSLLSSESTGSAFHAWKGSRNFKQKKPPAGQKIKKPGSRLK